MSLGELFGIGTTYQPVILGVILSLLLSSMFVPLFIRLSKKLKIMDRPSAGNHKTHVEPIPYLGGLAIATASLFSSAVAVYYGDYSAKFERFTLVISLGLIAMAILGLADDVKPRGAKQRLALQTLISLTVSIFLYELDLLQVQLTASPYLNVLICSFLLVSICNFLNMFDNHDGSASGVSLMILLFVLFLSIKSNQTLVLTVSSILIASVLPFLFWNLPPAKIYLGDSGATFLGTAIGVLLVSIDFTTLSPLSAVLASFCLIGMLILDFSVAVFSRLRRRISPMIGDKAHTAHRLMRLSLSKNQTTLVIWFITIWFGLHGVLATYTSGLELQLIFASAFISYLIFTYLFLRQPDE